MRFIEICVLGISISLIYGICVFIKTVISESTKHSFFHQMSGLWPLVLINTFLYTSYYYSSVAKFCPAMVIFAVGPFFTLCASRLIISSVSKTDFSLLNNFHLSAPFFVAIAIPVFYDNNSYLKYPGKTYVDTEDF